MSTEPGEDQEGRDDEAAWLVAAASSGCERVAFRFSEDAIVPASSVEAVIHAFLPTSEFAGALLKMNGDFSTDPSRKSVDWDDLSRGAFERCVELLAKCLRSAVVEGLPLGIFGPLVSDAPLEGRFRKILREELSLRFDRNGLPLPGRAPAKPAEICLAPDWLSYEDYEALCETLPHVPASLARVHPQLPAFLRWMGARPLGIEGAVATLATSTPSPLGCAQIVCRFARQFRFELTDARLTTLGASRVLATINGRVSPNDHAGEPIHPTFLSYIQAAAELDDVRVLFRRLKLQVELVVPTAPRIDAADAATTPSPAAASSRKQRSAFKAKPPVQLWRSAEKNAAAWFSALVEVTDVKDVSQANVGYDLEVTLRGGRRHFVEVKSVKHFGEAVRLTNNEHATAFQHGSDYLLAIVVNGEPFEVRVIPDPIRRLRLEKRCEQWSWYADDYRAAFVDLFRTEGGGDDDSAK